jgi:hypothetical protein
MNAAGFPAAFATLTLAVIAWRSKAEARQGIRRKSAEAAMISMPAVAWGAMSMMASVARSCRARAMVWERVVALAFSTVGNPSIPARFRALP